MRPARITARPAPKASTRSPEAAAPDERPPAAPPSLQRRLRFVGSWRHRTDRLWIRLGIECPGGVGRALDLAGQVAFDLIELGRARGAVDRPGRVHAAAFAAPGLLPQHPRYLNYWYDRERHVLVGMHLGLDINRAHGRYHVVECNTHPAMRPERRSLYPGELDPIVASLAAVARRFGFERVVFHRARAWSRDYLEEFERAARATGVAFTGASLGFVRGSKRPIVALPDELEPRTIYVGNWGQGTPISLFLHDKERVGRWLAEALAREGEAAAPLACVPTFPHPVLPRGPVAACWPNVVAKVANADGGRSVVMGRFGSEAEARAALEGSAAGAKLRRVGPLGRLLGGPAKLVYQPFVPTDVVEGRARLIRAHLFVSPLADALLSAHGVIAGKELPRELPFGLVDDPAPFVVNFSTGGRYARLEPGVEQELEEVARVFGRVARGAIAGRFEVGDPPPG